MGADRSRSLSPRRRTGADWDQIEASARRPEATICLVSALAYYGLTDAIPDALDVAIPRGAGAPVTAGTIRWHRFDSATFSIERDEIPIPGSSHTRSTRVRSGWCSAASAARGTA